MLFNIWACSIVQKHTRLKPNWVGCILGEEIGSVCYKRNSMEIVRLYFLSNIKQKLAWLECNTSINWRNKGWICSFRHYLIFPVNLKGFVVLFLWKIYIVPLFLDLTYLGGYSWLRRSYNVPIRFILASYPFLLLKVKDN